MTESFEAGSPEQEGIPVVGINRIIEEARGRGPFGVTMNWVLEGMDFMETDKGPQFRPDISELLSLVPLFGEVLDSDYKKVCVIPLENDGVAFLNFLYESDINVWYFKVDAYNLGRPVSSDELEMITHQMEADMMSYISIDQKSSRPSIGPGFGIEYFASKKKSNGSSLLGSEGDIASVEAYGRYALNLRPVVNLDILFKTEDESGILKGLISIFYRRIYKSALHFHRYEESGSLKLQYIKTSGGDMVFYDATTGTFLRTIMVDNIVKSGRGGIAIEHSYRELVSSYQKALSGERIKLRTSINPPSTRDWELFLGTNNLPTFVYAIRSNSGLSSRSNPPARGWESEIFIDDNGYIVSRFSPVADEFTTHQQTRYVNATLPLPRSPFFPSVITPALQNPIFETVIDNTGSSLFSLLFSGGLMLASSSGVIGGAVLSASVGVGLATARGTIDVINGSLNTGLAELSHIEESGVYMRKARRNMVVGKGKEKVATKHKKNNGSGRNKRSPAKSEQLQTGSQVKATRSKSSSMRQSRFKASKAKQIPYSVASSLPESFGWGDVPSDGDPSAGALVPEGSEGDILLVQVDSEIKKKTMARLYKEEIKKKEDMGSQDNKRRSEHNLVELKVGKNSTRNNSDKAINGSGDDELAVAQKTMDSKRKTIRKLGRFEQDKQNVVRANESKGFVGRDSGESETISDLRGNRSKTTQEEASRTVTKTTSGDNKRDFTKRTKRSDGIKSRLESDMYGGVTARGEESKQVMPSLNTEGLGDMSRLSLELSNSKVLEPTLSRLDPSSFEGVESQIGAIERYVMDDVICLRERAKEDLAIPNIETYLAQVNNIPVHRSQIAYIETEGARQFSDSIGKYSEFVLPIGRVVDISSDLIDVFSIDSIYDVDKSLFQEEGVKEWLNSRRYNESRTLRSDDELYEKDDELLYVNSPFDKTDIESELGLRLSGMPPQDVYSILAYIKVFLVWMNTYIRFVISQASFITVEP